MSFESRPKLMILMIAISFLLTQGCTIRGGCINTVFKSIGISMDHFDNFTLSEYKNEKIIAKSGDITLIILLNKNLEKNIAIKLVNDKTAILESQYEIRDAPYPGEITKEVVCPEEFRPLKNVINNSHNIINYELYSTNRFTYGVCVQDLAFYKSFIGFFYCNKNLIKIELFVPIGKEEMYKKILINIKNIECL